MSDVLHSLSRRSIERILAVLDDAEAEKGEWLRRWHRAVLSKANPPPQDLISENARFLTRFGSWYDLHKEDGLVDQSAFYALAEAHKRMHDHAAWLAVRGCKDPKIPAEEYDAFIDKVEAFSAQIKRLTRAFRAALSDLDPLTGVQNRQSMFAELERERSRSLRSKIPCCLALGDLDRFKKINDTYGHVVGDQVLASAAEVFLSGLRPYDTLYRYGGEEFLFCLPETTPDQAVIALDRLRDALEHRSISIPGNRPISVTASFGIAQMVGDASVEEVVQRADIALYRAKDLGRNRIEVWRASSPAPQQPAPGPRVPETGADRPSVAKVARPEKDVRR